MNLKIILDLDMKQAMKDKDKLTLSVIRLVKGSIQLEEINKKSILSNDDILSIIIKQVKMRKESIVEFEKANRIDLIEELNKEINILNKYLPIQLSDEELDIIITEVINKVNAKTNSDTGKIMKELVPLIKGKADMSKVNHIIKEKLSV